MNNCIYIYTYIYKHITSIHKTYRFTSPFLSFPTTLRHAKRFAGGHQGALRQAVQSMLLHELHGALRKVR